MINFPEIFSEGLDRCTKVKATLKIKENVTSIFKTKRKVPFAAEAFICKKLDRLKEIGVLTKTDYREWASLIIYVKKKNNKIRAWVDFSMGLGNCLETYK